VNEQTTIQLSVRTQRLTQDANGHNVWQINEAQKVMRTVHTALLLCDVWDKHWSRGARERVDQMVPSINDIAHALRERGALIIHAPSDTMDFYEGTPARQRVLNVPQIELPTPIAHPDPPLPIDDTDHGSDTGESAPHKAWQRQHAGIDIDHQHDVISDDGVQVYNLLRQHSVDHLLIAGVHTNMCVLNRSFGIKAMVRWQVDTMLVRDLTDTMYNPAMPPYVNHAQGTELVVAYIEKFWCPTVRSRDLV
jgi:nicotinamidase-related amidase